MANPTLAQPTSSTGDFAANQLFRLSVEWYLWLWRDAAITESDQVELIDGIWMRKVSRNARRDWSISRLQLLPTLLVQTSWAVRTQCAFMLADIVLEPDVVLAVGPLSRYESATLEPLNAKS